MARTFNVSTITQATEKVVNMYELARLTAQSMQNEAASG